MDELMEDLNEIDSKLAPLIQFCDNLDNNMTNNDLAIPYDPNNRISIQNPDGINDGIFDKDI